VRRHVRPDHQQSRSFFRGRWSHGWPLSGTHRRSGGGGVPAVATKSDGCSEGGKGERQNTRLGRRRRGAYAGSDEIKPRRRAAAVLVCVYLKRLRVVEIPGPRILAEKELWPTGQQRQAWAGACAYGHVERKARVRELRCGRGEGVLVHLELSNASRRVEVDRDAGARRRDRRRALSACDAGPEREAGRACCDNESVPLR